MALRYLGFIRCNRRWLAAFFFLLPVVLCSGFSKAQESYSSAAGEPQSNSRFVRFIEGPEQWQGKLQTSIVTYKNESGATLSLVAAVHMADEHYYDTLNDYFQSQDVVLYELVAESEQRPAFGETAAGFGAGSPVSMMQRAMARFLKVSFQLEQIDYTQANFRHADVSPAQLNEIMQSKNENTFSMFLSLALAQSVSQTTSRPESGLGSLAMLRAMMTQQRDSVAKYLLAKELSNAELSVLSAELEAQLTILGDRNLAALRVLKASLKEPQLRQLSIFYGAAHMPGIERAIVSDFGFEKVGEQWLDAWIIP
ncbi:MAG: hypothetical protein ACJAS2_001832 [Pseudohongiellaceae bacterium]|jgi:hypothetical protein